MAAISTLKNLCDEPANLIPMTNTNGCVSTLMYFAHAAGREKSDLVVTELMQYRACDALATLSHWLRKIATSGASLDAAQKKANPFRAKDYLFLSSGKYLGINGLKRHPASFRVTSGWYILYTIVQFITFLLCYCIIFSCSLL